MSAPRQHELSLIKRGQDHAWLPRRKHSPAFKAKVAVAAIEGEKMLIKLAQVLDVHPIQDRQWRDRLLERPTAAFGDGFNAELEQAVGAKTCMP